MMLLMAAFAFAVGLLVGLALGVVLAPPVHARWRIRRSR